LARVAGGLHGLRRIDQARGGRKPKGYLFSYYAQFYNNGGKELIASPRRDTYANGEPITYDI
jgi:hypothetical protein